MVRAWYLPIPYKSQVYSFSYFPVVSTPKRLQEVPPPTYTTTCNDSFYDSQSILVSITCIPSLSTSLCSSSLDCSSTSRRGSYLLRHSSRRRAMSLTRRSCPRWLGRCGRSARRRTWRGRLPTHQSNSQTRLAWSSSPRIKSASTMLQEDSVRASPIP